jgi:pimeloyl-ACP methyl ester carboxylesterase
MHWSAHPDAPLRIDGVALEYACYGPPPDQAPTIILLHEGLGCLALWRDFPQKLAERTGMGVFVWSRQGYGQSDAADLPRPIDFMTREAVDVLPQVLDRIGLRRGILFGHSDGATVAAIYAGTVSDARVRGLILMAPHFFTEPGGLAEITAARQSFVAGDMKARMAKYHRDPAATFSGWNDVWLAEGFRDWNVAEVIDYWRIPVLAIQGREDQYGTLAQVAEIEARIYAPLDIEILENCRHAPHFEQPVKTLEAVGAFTERLERIESEVVLLCQSGDS